MITPLEVVRATIEAGVDQDAMQALLPTGGARNALDCAFWDLQAKKSAVAAWDRLNMTPKTWVSVATTYGTGTMVKTAEALQGIAGKCIVFTGALQPPAFYQTDTIFNVGCAIGAAQNKDAGVYIAMNAQIFDADTVFKNVNLNRFEQVSIL